MSSPVFRENLRDTHFAGFAKLLWKELEGASRYTTIGHDDHGVTLAPTREMAEAIIAKRAYDLVDHILKQVSVTYVPDDGYIHLLRDMDEWPS